MDMGPDIHRLSVQNLEVILMVGNQNTVGRSNTISISIFLKTNAICLDICNCFVENTKLSLSVEMVKPQDQSP